MFRDADRGDRAVLGIQITAAVSVRRMTSANVLLTMSSSFCSLSDSSRSSSVVGSTSKRAANRKSNMSFVSPYFSKDVNGVCLSSSLLSMVLDHIEC